VKVCSAKTGTITQGRVILEKHLDVAGVESQEVLNYSYLNSFHQTGLKNMLDLAVLAHVEVAEALQVRERYRKIDEIPFDFVRRRMSVAVEDHQHQHILICKGAVEEIVQVCTQVELQGTRPARRIASEADSRIRERSQRRWVPGAGAGVQDHAERPAHL